jgi:hypothetical protein
MAMMWADFHLSAADSAREKGRRKSEKPAAKTETPRTR